MRLLPALLACVLPVAAIAGPFDGRYRPNYDWAKAWDCERVGVEGGAMEISGESYHGLAGACALTKPVEVRGMDGVLYDLACPDKTTRIMLLRHAFGLYAISDGLVLDWLACE